MSALAIPHGAVLALIDGSPCSVAELHAIVCDVPRPLGALAVGASSPWQCLADLHYRESPEILGRTLGQAVPGGPGSVAQQHVPTAAALKADGDTGSADLPQQLAEPVPSWVPGRVRGAGSRHGHVSPRKQIKRFKAPSCKICIRSHSGPAEQAQSTLHEDASVVSQRF